MPVFRQKFCRDLIFHLHFHKIKLSYVISKLVLCPGIQRAFFMDYKKLIEVSQVIVNLIANAIDAS